LYGKNESSTREVTKNKEKIRDMLVKVKTIARDKVLMKVGKSLKFLGEKT